MEIYVDGDACPVKDEVIRVAERHGITVHMVSNGGLGNAQSRMVRRVIVSADPDAADDWIAEHCGADDVVVTADIPLADRCLKRGAGVLGPTGKPFDADNIGMTLATRNLMAQLREAGEITGGGRPFSKQDRSRFLQALEQAVRAIKNRQAE